MPSHSSPLSSHEKKRGGGGDLVDLIEGKAIEAKDKANIISCLLKFSSSFK